MEEKVDKGPKKKYGMKTQCCHGIQGRKARVLGQAILIKS